MASPVYVTWATTTTTSGNTLAIDQHGTGYLRLPNTIAEPMTSMTLEEAKAYLEKNDFVVISQERLQRLNDHHAEAGKHELLRELGLQVSDTSSYETQVTRIKQALEHLSMKELDAAKKVMHYKIEQDRLKLSGGDFVKSSWSRSRLDQVRDVLAAMVRNGIPIVDILEAAQEGVDNGTKDLKAAKYRKDRELLDELRSLPWKK